MDPLDGPIAGLVEGDTFFASSGIACLGPSRAPFRILLLAREGSEQTQFPFTLGREQAHWASMPSKK